jgi:hypothetical protein
MPILVALRDRIGECDSGEGGFRIRSIMARKAVTAISR